MRKSIYLLMVVSLLAGVTFVGCESGDDMESKFAKALSDVNKDWQLYEITKSRGALTIKVEVTSIISFKEAKKAVAAIQKSDPKFAGYIDFFDSRTSTVVRKMEIIPETPST